jgi:hypothetical protein
VANAPIAFQSSEGRYHYEGVAQLLNAYAEKRGNDAKGPLSVLPSDGIIEFCDEAPGPCRGLIYLPDLDKIYAIHPSSVYRVTYDGTTATATRIGTAPGSDTVQLSRNQNASPQTFINGELANLIIATDSVAPVTDSDFPDDVVSVEYAHGYTVAGVVDRTFFTSGLNESGDWEALEFATFEQQAGKLVRVQESSGELIGFCSQWMEFWRDVGDVDFPFAPVAFRSRGLKAKNGVLRCDNTLMFPGDDDIIYRLNNYDPTRISTHSIERLIQEDAAAEDIVGTSWSRGGHAFANFTGTDWSRCYDAATGVWHTRQSYGYDTWRAKHAVQAWGKTIVGDAITGKLGYLDSNTFTEYDEPMIWGVDSPPLHVFPNGAIVDAFHMDLATGYGTLSGQGSEPKIMLQVSKDGGNTFQQYRELELGVTGHYATRVTARRLGKFGPKGIVFRLRISDPVVRALVGTDIQLRPLKR